jgi:hypothetical protein
VQLLVGLRQWLAGEPGRDAGVEVGALRDVLVGTVQPVPDGLADGLRPVDLLVEFRELALHELSPVAERAGAGGQEGRAQLRNRARHAGFAGVRGAWGARPRPARGRTRR